MTNGIDRVPIIINLGCGFKKIEGAINVDAYDICEPDVVWDLNKTPFPFKDNSADQIVASHIFEHLENWYGAFKECGRILKNAGMLLIRVPDESSSSALTYRDHLHVFSQLSFHGASAKNYRSGTNAWAKTVEGETPLKLVGYHQYAFKEYRWMIKWCPWLLFWCSKHLRNFIAEQQLEFQKQITDRGKQ